jgi:hypothetical protein
MAGFWGLPAPADLPNARVGAALGEFRHTITHHHYRLRVAMAGAGGRKTGAGGLGPGAGGKTGEFGWFKPSELGRIPLSTTARKALKLAGIATAPPAPDTRPRAVPAPGL